MKMTINAAQGQPSFNVLDDKGIIKAKVYYCIDGVVVSTTKGKFRLPPGIRKIQDQVGSFEEVPRTDGFEV